MKARSVFLALATLSLSAAPALADTVSPAASLSLSKSVRAGGSHKGDKLAGGGLIIALVAAAAVVAGIVVVATDNSSSN